MSDTQTRPIRVKRTDQLGNISYVIKNGRHVRCQLANGTPAGLFYAGVLGDETATMFALEDAETPLEVLDIIRRDSSARVELI